MLYVAIFGMIYAFFKSVFEIVKFLYWKRKGFFVATVKELKRKEINYENEKKGKISTIEYIYILDVCNDGKLSSVNYTETVAGDNPSKTQLNSSLPVFVDFEEKEARNAEELKKSARQWPICLAISVVVVILLVFIAGITAD